MGYFIGRNKEQNKNQSNHIHVQPSTASMAGTNLISMIIIKVGARYYKHVFVVYSILVGVS